MKNIITATLVAGGMTAAVLGVTGIATAAPTGPSQVDQTVKTLEADGYNVIINRTGAQPLAACTVTAVRPGQTHSTIDSRGGSSPAETIVSKTVHVDIEC